MKIKTTEHTDDTEKKKVKRPRKNRGAAATKKFWKGGLGEEPFSKGFPPMERD